MAAGDNAKIIKATLRARLGDRDGSRWSDAELYVYLNEAFMELALALPDNALPHLTSVDSDTLVAGRNNYDLPSDFLRARLVKYKDIVAKHWPAQEREALRADSLLVPSETNPFWYIEDGDIYFEVSAVTQSGAETYELWYIKQPTTISDTADPDLPAHYWDLVETYAFSRCMEPERNFDMAELMRKHFDEECFLTALRHATPEAFEGVAFDPDLDTLKPQ